jgi:hypothetical protein
MKALYLFILLLSIPGCFSGKRDYNIRNLHSEICIIEEDSLSLPFYNIWSINPEISNYLGYNKYLHSIDFFDLSRGKFLKRIFLEKSGPGVVGIPVSIHYYKPDSIFLFDNRTICLFSEDGGLYCRFDPFAAEGYDFNVHGELFLNNSVPLKYNHKSKSVYLGCNQYKDELKKPLFAEFNLSDKSLDFLNLYYPEDVIEKNKQYGFLKQVALSRDTESGLMYYNYMFRPGFCVYSFSDRTNSFNGVVSEGIDDANQFIDSGEDDKIDSHSLINPSYYAPLVTPDTVFQFCFESVNLQRSDGEMSTFRDKNWSVLVFDKAGHLSYKGNVDFKPIQLNSWFYFNGYIYYAPHPSGLEKVLKGKNSLLFMRIKAG